MPIATVARIAAATCLTLALAGCNDKPRSGKYCSTQSANECVRIDIERDTVTFYEDGRPNDVTGVLLHGAIEAFPTTGQYARKVVRITFDVDASDRMSLEVGGERGPDGFNQQTTYQLRK